MLTTLPRREWATARKHIIACSDHNKTALDVVDGALFVLVLDNIEPKDIHEAAANMLHGTYNLRTEDNLIDYQVCQTIGFSPLPMRNEISNLASLTYDIASLL